MSEITIPPAALEAGAHALCGADGGYCGNGCPDCTRAARAAFLAIVEAWPGVRHYPDMEVFASKARIILPLPTEASDE